MEENNYKYAKNLNLPTLNIKSQLNMNIDSNTNIKQVLDIETCLIETQIEALSNKALVKGTLGIKVVYLDMDNMFNALSDSINFSETINDENITSNCQINIGNSQFITEFEYNERSLKIFIEGSMDCFCNCNNNLNIFNPNDSQLVAKKSIIQTCNCTQKINKNLTFDYDFKIDAKINKMLSCNSKIIIDDVKCYDGYILINGQIINYILCEVENNDLNSIKINSNTTPFKCEVEASDCNTDCTADISAYINLNNTQITTEILDNTTQFNFEYCIVVDGYIFKNSNIDVIEDVYSLESIIDPVFETYTISKKEPYFKTNENVDTEITLADEFNIDEILGMVNTSSSISQHSIKNNAIVVEGVVSGNLLYFDENHEIKHLPTQLPYSISIKQENIDNISALHIQVIPIACKCKIKRGNTLMVDYELCISGCAYSEKQIQLINNIKYGTPINYGDIAFQIYIARTGESDWDLCKRLHVTKEQLVSYNNNIPQNYSGGEKIIIYR